MAVVAMQKVAILAVSTLKEELIDFLHKEGVMEVTEAKTTGDIDHTEVQFRSAELKFAIETLQAVASKETLSTMKKPSEAEDILHSATHTDVRGIVDALHTLEESDTNAERRLQELSSLTEQLTPWKDLPYMLSAEKETKTSIRMLGTLPELQVKALEEALQAELPRFALSVINKVGAAAYIAAHVWKEDAKRFEEIATGLGWTAVELPEFPNITAHALVEIATEEQKLTEQKEKNAKRREELSVELPNLLKTARFLSWLDEKQSVRETMAETVNTVTLLGWMPKKKVELIESKLQQISDAIAVLRVKADEGEEPPMQIWNPAFLAPFEAVTRLYGLPQQGEMDPTRPLLPFFILYFGLCLTDAGYGMVMALLMLGAILKFKLKRQEAKLVWLLFYAGIVTFFVSIPFGGWFGMLPEQAPAWATYTNEAGQLRFLGQKWDLQKDVDFFRNLALSLGAIQLLFGVTIAGWWKWIHGAKMDAFMKHFSLHIFLLALAGKYLVQFEGADYVVIAALVLFVWGQGSGKWFIRPLTGVLGTVNFGIGIMSNILSYLRILALGLATGALAFAINQIASVISDLLPGPLGIPAFIIILIFGHLISIALNGLGSFVHSGRLQFIEFFGQFFQGGGREFQPFKRSNAL